MFKYTQSFVSANFGMQFYRNVSNCWFLVYCEIINWFRLFLSVTSKMFSSLCSFSYSMEYCICGSSLLRTFKNSLALFLLLKWAWEVSTYLRNVFGAMSNLKTNSKAFFSRFSNNSLMGQPLLEDQLALN